MEDLLNKYGRKIIGDIFQHVFMIKIRICDTFELTKRVFSGSGQMPLNTLLETLAERQFDPAETLEFLAERQFGSCQDPQISFREAV